MIAQLIEIMIIVVIIELIVVVVVVAVIVPLGVRFRVCVYFPFFESCFELLYRL